MIIIRTLSTSNKPSLLKLTIPAGGATPSPPVGPALGQKGVKAMDFCRQFNDQSAKTFLPSLPLRCRILVNSDRTFGFSVASPSTAWLLKRAAGVEKADSGRTVAYLNGKFVYEIAKIKAKDPLLAHMPLRLLYRMIVAQSRAIGIKIFL